MTFSEAEAYLSKETGFKHSLFIHVNPMKITLPFGGKDYIVTHHNLKYVIPLLSHSPLSK